jgi:hypothetical protein
MRRWLYRSVTGLAFLWIPTLVLLAQEKKEKPEKPEKAPASKSYTPRSDLPLVEKVIGARKEYEKYLRELHDYYESSGDIERQRWAREELMSFHRSPKRAYRLDLDVPPPVLKPEHNIPEANELFRKAMAYKGRGWGQEYEDNLIRAEHLLQELLSSYPHSDKIDDAAYQLADIYESRSFQQYGRAAQYFERVYQWNSNTDSDARLRAAKLYDQKLLDRGKAMQLYKAVVNHDADEKRVQDARKRLASLSSAPP